MNKKPDLVVLIYHRVGSGTASPIDVPTPVFEQQLRALCSSRDVVSLDAALDAAQRGLHRPTAVLTFDDGYADFYTNAWPILKSRGLPATLYLATDYIDTGRRFPWDAPFSASQTVRPLTWTQVQELATSDLITIGSHTHTHRRLDRLPSDEIHRDIEASRERIARHVGREATHFAYPRGIPSASSATLGWHGFRSVAVAGWRPNAGAVNPHHLYRIPAIPSRDLSMFEHTLTGAAWPFEALSAVRNRLQRGEI